MKKITITYWILTGILAAFMTYSAVASIMMLQSGVTLMHVHLGYPEYIIPFLGVAKLLGSIAIVVPGLPHLKEWAYAGFTFDVAGATYSFIKSGDPVSQWIFMIVFLALIAGSYIFWHKKQKAQGKAIGD